MTFEEYLTSKKIDSRDFQEREKGLWEEWKAEFDQMSTVSFSSRKLYLINPIRRKYPLQVKPRDAETQDTEKKGDPGAAVAPAPSDQTKTERKPGSARPVIKPKPKIT